MNVGDKVLYVPHAIYARQQNVNSPLYKGGEYTWVMGRKTQVRDKLTGEFKESVEELSSHELDKFLQQLRSNQNPQAWAALALIRPNVMWMAVVTGTWPDGTVDLDVNCGGGPATLHVDHITVDQKDKRPHTCHVAEGEVENPHLVAHAYSQIQGRGLHRCHKHGKSVMVQQDSPTAPPVVVTETQIVQ